MKFISRSFDLLKPVLPKFTSNRFYSLAAAESLDPYQEEEMKKNLIVLNEKDEMIGYDTKYNCHRLKNGKLPLHRAFSVLIFNSSNEILLQQRAANKVLFPNHVSTACVNHPLHSTFVYRDGLQTMKNYIVTRMMVELGIHRREFCAGDLQYVTKVKYFSKGDGTWGEHEINYIFVFQKDVEIKPNTMEVKQVWSVPRNEFKEFVKNCEYPLTPWFSIIQKQWLFKIWDNLEDLKAIRDDTRTIQKHVEK